MINKEELEEALGLNGQEESGGAPEAQVNAPTTESQQASFDEPERNRLQLVRECPVCHQQVSYWRCLNARRMNWQYHLTCNHCKTGLKMDQPFTKDSFWCYAFLIPYTIAFFFTDLLLDLILSVNLGTWKFFIKIGTFLLLYVVVYFYFYHKLKNKPVQFTVE